MKLVHMIGSGVSGETDKAEGALRAAREAAERFGALPLLWRVHRTLGQVLLVEGTSVEAEEEFAAGRALVADLATRVPDDRLRDGFLAL